MPINLEKYFERISYKGSTEISIETLKRIHAAQVLAIPFENLEIHAEINTNNQTDFIALDGESIFNKLVLNKRGGYCHENNELLALILIELGFKVTRLAARVLTAPDLPKTHKLLMVTIDNQHWIADAGFGGYGLFEPIALVTDQVINQYNDSFKLVENNKKYTLQFLTDGLWKDIYCFDLEPATLADYKQMNYFVSHHPDSLFVKNRICVMPRPEGRVILNNFQLKIITNKKVKNITINDELEYLKTLKLYFGIILDKNIKLRKIQTEKPLRTTKTSLKPKIWCSFFVGAVLTLGTMGAICLATAGNQSNKNNKI